MDILFLIGRIIVGLFYIMSAANHFMQVDMMSGFAESKGVPSGRLAVLGSGLLLLIGGLSIITGFQPVIGIIAVVLFLIPVSLMMHNFWAIEDEQESMAQMTNFLKNMGLLGSTLMFLAIPQPWPLSLGG